MSPGIELVLQVIQLDGVKMGFNSRILNVKSSCSFHHTTMQFMEDSVIL